VKNESTIVGEIQLSGLAPPVDPVGVLKTCFIFRVPLALPVLGMNDFERLVMDLSRYQLASNFCVIGVSRMQSTARPWSSEHWRSQWHPRGGERERFAAAWPPPLKVFLV
jgi:hypothetical protein